MSQPIRMIVASCNAIGEPDLFFCKVFASPKQVDNGDHYERAKQAASDDGYEGDMVAFDENDSAGKAMLPLFVWDTATRHYVGHEDDVEQEVA